MRFLKAATAIGVTVALLGVSTIAQAAPASSASRLSLSNASAKIAPGARVGAVRKGENKAGGSTILLVLAGLAVTAGIVVAADGGDSDSN